MPSKWNVYTKQRQAQTQLTYHMLTLFKKKIQIIMEIALTRDTTKPIVLFFKKKCSPSWNFFSEAQGFAPILHLWREIFDYYKTIEQQHLYHDCVD